jgi:hypothetical protein
MASLYKKTISGKPYYYLREMGWVDGKPKLVSERYLGSVADIVAAMDRAEAGTMPDRTGHRRFGDAAAVWGLLVELDVAGVIDEVIGARRSDAGASVGTYLVLAALGRLVEPGSKSRFAEFWAATAADRFTRISPKVLGHRKFWDAMHAVDTAALQEISTQLAARMISRFGLDTSSVALDMTNFATYIDTTNDKAPIAQRGKAKQKRTDLRLVGLGLVVTRAGGIPLVWHAYPGNRPDVTQFGTLIDHLTQRYGHLADAVAAAGGAGREGVGGGAGGVAESMTVVFDAGQNSAANFHHLRATGLHYVGSVPPNDCPDLLALPASGRTVVDPDRYPGVTAIDTRRPVYGLDRRVVLIHSQDLHDDQARSFTGTTLAKAARQLDELAATLARGKTRRTHDQVTAEITTITANSWVAEVIEYTLTGDTPAQRSDLVNQHRETGRVGRQGVRETDPDHRPGRLARRRRRRRLPIPIRDRVRLPATQRPPPGVVLPDVPLDRPQHRRPHLHLRPGPATGPPAAAQSPPGRPRPDRPQPPGHPQGDRRNRADLPLHRWPTQSPADHHRHDRRPTSALRPVQPPPMGTINHQLGHRNQPPPNRP